MDESEFGDPRKSLYIPSLFIAALWFIRIAEWITASNINYLGILPRHAMGLPGLITGPFIHSTFSHLASNTVPILLLGAGVLYFYKDIAYKIIGLIYFLTNLLVWIGARPSYHIGASGLVYGFAAFLFFSGVLRKEQRLMGISMLVVFIYGSMAWGVFPGQPGVSWESHLFGAMVGTVLAFYYRKEGPQRKKYDWEDDDPEAGKSYEESIADLTRKQSGGGKVRYIYRDQ
jgi:membrane associated rhomboid family serine protease